MEEKKKSEGRGGWLVIIVLFAMGLWPVALILLLMKLYGKDKDKAAVQKAPPLHTEETQQTSAGQAKKKAGAVGKLTRTPTAKKSTAKWLFWGGVVLAAAGLYSAWEAVDMMIWLESLDPMYMEDLVSGIGIFAGGAVMMISGRSMSRSIDRYQRYIAVMGDREAISVEELARTLGYPQESVEKDLKKMLSKGYFGGKAFLNVELGYLLRTGRADAELRRRQQEQQEKPRQEQEQEEKPRSAYDSILEDIRRANDDIADEALSAKIDQLESITAHIFRLVREDPEKEKRIGTFLNYYLPTTQKLLDSYAKFEAAGVEGENLRQAKARIEATMDTIVEGFAHQLDELYKADAMDVDTDIRVMETMLHRDTASAARDFGLDTDGTEKH